ncbi:MAG: GntR family transcriptional regulator [Ferruginibacter sp.]|nr:GntR family transcriptional regulator [Ferruginibacter sp.]
MLNPVLYNSADKMPIYKQIALSIGKQIDKGLLKKNFLLPSINLFSEQYAVARDTVERAYKELKKQGYITSVSGKGFYVVGKKENKIKILLVFNKLSSFKKIIYYSFLKTLADKAVVDLQIHHYNPQHLKKIIEANLGKYDHYVIMPHFETNADKKAFMDILKKIPPEELLLLDKSIPELTGSMSVFQDFRTDIFDALVSALELLEKYNTLSIIFPEYSNHPPEIIEGLQQFCKNYDKRFTIITNGAKIKLVRGTAFIVIADDDLAILVKAIRKSSYQTGKDIGIISFNETELKDLLDITVISTDFEKMGHTAARLILKNQIRQIKNPFKIIKRGSL